MGETKNAGGLSGLSLEIIEYIFLILRRKKCIYINTYAEDIKMNCGQSCQKQNSRIETQEGYAQRENNPQTLQRIMRLKSKHYRKTIAILGLLSLDVLIHPVLKIVVYKISAGMPSLSVHMREKHTLSLSEVGKLKIHKLSFLAFISRSFLITIFSQFHLCEQLNLQHDFY